MPSNSLLLFNISKIFLLDFVPDWTAIPAGLFITTKFSLFSINKLDKEDNSFFVALYLSFFLSFFFDIKLKFLTST